MAEVTVIGAWGSPFSRRVEMALKLKGVEYEFIDEDLANKSPLLLQNNPVHKKVPVLIHNGKPIAESTVILEYIDETWKQHPLFPQDPFDRAMARFWAKFLDDKCLPSVWKIIWAKGQERETAMEEASNNLKILESELKDYKFFGGETIGVVDIVANFVGFWLKVIEEAAGFELVTREKFPKLCDWIDEFLTSESSRQNLPPRDKLLAFFQARFNGSWKY